MSDADAPFATSPEIDDSAIESSRSLPRQVPDDREIIDRLRRAEQYIADCLEDYGVRSPAVPQATPELSVVIPCLNEAETLGVCVQKAMSALEEHAIAGEVIVADNGSTDGSQEIAASLGARVVHAAERGYGSALMAGIEAAAGKYIIMGDADDSYDFLEIPRFLEELRGGHELVQGCRLPSGGGRVMPGAMPLLHRWWGNPMFTWMVRTMFRAPIHDVYCGLRGFTKDLYDRLGLRCTGMEFATEMIIKSSLFGVDIAEVPTTLHPDGRQSNAPHLRTFRDGWRTLRFLLMYSPRWLFLVPGLLLCLAGVGGYVMAMPAATLFGATLDAHTLLIASLAIMIGYQLLQFAMFAKTFAISEGLLPGDACSRAISGYLTLERGILAGGVSFVVGLGLLTAATSIWQATGFGALDYASTMRWVIPGVTLSAIGFQTIFASFFVSLLRMARK